VRCGWPPAKEQGSPPGGAFPQRETWRLVMEIQSRLAVCNYIIQQVGDRFDSYAEFYPFSYAKPILNTKIVFLRLARQNPSRHGHHQGRGLSPSLQAPRHAHAGAADDASRNEDRQKRDP
jgi:hypothetical protein